jgi:hypothetical protein
VSRGPGVEGRESRVMSQGSGVEGRESEGGRRWSGPGLNLGQPNQTDPYDEIKHLQVKAVFTSL